MDYELLIQRVMEEVRKRLAEEEAKKAVCGKKEECATAKEVKRVALNKKFIMEKDVRAAKEQGAGAVEIPGTSKITDLAKEYAHEQGHLLIIDGKTDKARR